MTKLLTAKAAWLKELRYGEEHSIWRIGAEIIDDELRDARKLLDASGLPYAARDVLRLARIAFDAKGLHPRVHALAKARLDLEGLPYDAADLIEMIALFSAGMDMIANDDGEDDDEELCADCAGAVRH